LANSQLALEASVENILMFIGLGLAIGLLSGAYPAMILSRFSPIQAMRGVFSSKVTDKHMALRGLVGFQFVLSIFLIICAFGMSKQMNYLLDKNLGFEEDQIVIVPFNGSGQSFTQTWQEAEQLKQVLKNELAGKGVKNIVSSSHTFGTQGWVQFGYVDPITDGFRQFFTQKIDEDYLDVMEMELSEGRNFSKEIKTDSNGVIINETFAKKWELTNPIGANLPEPWQEFQIIGVAKDFHFQSLHSNVEPLVMTMDLVKMFRAAPDRNFTDSPIPKLSFKISGENLPATLSNIQNEIKNVAPEEVFAYTFMDENIGRQYESEQLLSRILSLATALAIFIACLGLFGIATLTIAQKTKEIGVRKVLGASTSNIVLMLNKNFTILVLIATIIAAPIAWYFMKEWLADFAFQTDLNIWLFVFSGLVVLGIAWLSVGYQSLKAAMANPVESLRSE
jgi:putative ABC transport system permease protein